MTSDADCTSGWVHGSSKWWPCGPFVLWQWHVAPEVNMDREGKHGALVGCFTAKLGTSLSSHPAGWSLVPGSWWGCGRGLVWGGNKRPGRHPLNRICQIHATASATNILNYYQNNSIENVSYHFCYLMGEMMLLWDCHLEDYVERESSRCVLGSVSRQFLFYLCQSLSPGLPHVNWLFHCVPSAVGAISTQRDSECCRPAAWCNVLS